MKWHIFLFFISLGLAIGGQGEAIRAPNLPDRDLRNKDNSTDEIRNKRQYSDWLNDKDQNATKPAKMKVEKDDDPEWFDDNEDSNSTKPSKMTDEGKSDGFSYNDKNKEDGNYEILTEEGQEGWMEKLLAKVKAKNKNKKPKTNPKHRNYQQRTKFGTNFYQDIPSSTLTRLNNGFAKIGDKASGAKQGLINLESKWNNIPFGDRAVVTQTLQSAASNIEKFANAGDDPLGAVRGAIDMVAQFAALAGPKGQIVSIALSFVSGFLSLFGSGGKQQKSVGQIVREEIEEALAEHYEKSLSNEAQGTISAFQTSKAYVDTLARRGKILTENQALVLKTSVPLWQGLPMLGTLASEIRNLLRQNKEKDAKKVLRYIELYTTIAVMKDMIMQQTAALLPEELAPNREALLVAQIELRNTQKDLLEFLYSSDLASNVIPSFDPDVNPVTDAYLSTILKVPNYRRSWAGIWCLTPSIRGQPLTPLSWTREHSGLMIDDHPYVAVKNSGCFWKLIPHGNQLFTVQNTYKCPKEKDCGKYMNFDIVRRDRDNRVTIEQYPILWEIVGTHQKRIRSKWGCSSDSKWCNKQIGPQIERHGFLGFSSARTFALRDDNVGYVWFLTKNPKRRNHK